MKNYEKIEGTSTELKVEVYYNKGGMNYFTGRNESRGYYVSVVPVTVERRDNGIAIESFTAFSGVKELVKEVGRKSDKAYAEAIALAEGRVPQLKEYIKSRLSA